MIECAHQLGQRQIRKNEGFQFKCHEGLECFNTCCRNKRLPLYPYDLLALKNGLKIPSAKILEQYIELEIDPQSGWPTLRFKLTTDGVCPFVSQTGCKIYHHRPSCCRIYPFARAITPKTGDASPAEVFFVTQTDHCLGWQEKQTMTIETWIEDQKIEPYHQANNRILKLFMHPRRRHPMSLTEKQIHAVIMALYNLDVFRQIIKQPGFAEKFKLQSHQIESALNHDQALLELGQEWITAQLFG